MVIAATVAAACRVEVVVVVGHRSQIYFVPPSLPSFNGMWHSRCPLPVRQARLLVLVQLGEGGKPHNTQISSYSKTL